MTLLLLFALLYQTLAQHSDLVTGLIPEYTSPWYSGFFNISSNKALHYVFFESLHDHDNDPIIFWLGSDLGCSSLLAMVQQNGPFLFHTDRTDYYISNHSWNKYASLLYIETPAPVGFSIGSGSNSDQSVAKDNLEALVAFLNTHPNLRNNQLYLSGSGYSGTFAAYLATEILSYNQRESTHIKVNLKGLLLGNPCVHPTQCHDAGVDGISYHGYEFLYKHGFYTEEQYQSFKSACSWDFSSTSCYEIRSQLQKLFKDTNTSTTNIYHKCYYQQDHYGDLRCQDTRGADHFFNDAGNQIKLHVFQTARDWKSCNHEVGYKYKGNQNGSYPLYQTLLKNLKVWIYSGDVSADVPLTGTLSWIQKLREEIHLPIMEPWREWWVKGLHIAEDQVAGMVWKVLNLTLVTVKGAGFQTARNHPQALEAIVKNFLSGTDLPRKGQL